MATTASVLTPAQMRFAKTHDARAGIEAGNGYGVFFYREDGDLQFRWLVDADGNVRETAQLHKHS
jgi:hypothetical protein